MSSECATPSVSLRYGTLVMWFNIPHNGEYIWVYIPDKEEDE